MDRSRRVLIIGDSVSMPRPEIRYEDTWICRLKNEFPGFDIIDKSGRGTTSFRLVTEGGGGVDLLETYMPGTVILQFGITECAPRLFNKKGLEFFIVSRILPTGLRERYIQSVKKRRVRNPDLTDVSPEDFYRNIRNFFIRAGRIDTQVLIIPIIRPSNLFREKSPHIGGNVEWYNSIIREVADQFRFVNIVTVFDDDFDINSISLDELHINAEGHEMIYNRISRILRQS